MIKKKNSELRSRLSPTQRSDNQRRVSNASHSQKVKKPVKSWPKLISIHNYRSRKDTGAKSRETYDCLGLPAWIG